MTETLVATPDPPEEPGDVLLAVEIVPEPTSDPEPVALATPVEIIDSWLGVTRFRYHFASSDVTDMLLDIRNAITRAA